MGINSIARRANQNIQIITMVAFCPPTGVPTKPAQINTMKMKRLGRIIDA
jgi:hypothetical protein